MKNEVFNVTIPFPAWEGIFQVNDICDELRRNEMLKGIPVHRTPRRISMKEKGKQEGFDDVKVVEYWFIQGCYVTATLGGSNHDSYGTSWELVDFRLRWKDSVLGLSMADEKINLRLNADQLRIISLTPYLRRRLRGHEGYATLPIMQAQLAEATESSNVIIAELTAPIQAAHARQRVWVATNKAKRGGHEFSWLPGAIR